MTELLEKIAYELATRNLKAVSDATGITYNQLRMLALREAKRPNPDDIDTLVAFLRIA